MQYCNIEGVDWIDNDSDEYDEVVAPPHTPYNTPYTHPLHPAAYRLQPKPQLRAPALPPLLPLWRVLLVGGSDDKIRICQ